MARVTVFQGGNVAPEMPSTARFRPADYGPSGLAAGLQALGGALGDASQVAQTIAARRAEARVKKADVEAELELAKLRGAELAQERFGALGAVDRYSTEARKIKERISSTMARGFERDTFVQIFDERLARDLPTLQVHETRQTVAAEREASASRIATYVDRAVELREDREASMEALQTALAEADTLYADEGPDVLRSKRNALVSAYHVQVADALQDSDPGMAKRYVDDHASQILEADETKIRRQLRPHVEEAELDDAMSAVERIIGSGAGAGEEVPPSTTARSEAARTSADPLRGKGRVTATPQQHLKRGRLALDIAAPPGTPIYPPQSGKVIEKGFKAEGNGHYVRVRHANGLVTTYLHMRGESPLDVGEEVDAGTVIGSVGSTGKSTGPHLDYSVADARGRAIDPTKVKWEEPDLPAYRPRRNDAEALYDAARRVATERNFSRRQYDGLLRRVDDLVTREDRLKARQEDEAVRAALDVVESLGSGFTRKDQIANWAELPAGTRMQLTGMIERNTRPAPIEANGDRALQLELMSVYEPNAFVAADLRLFRHEVTASEFAALANKQAQMRTKGQAAPEFVDHGRIWGMITRYGADVGLEPGSKDKDERKRSHRVFEMVRNDLARLTEGKRRPSDDEVKAAFDRATLEVVVRGGGTLGLSNSRERLFDVAPGARVNLSIPQAVAERIIGSFRRTEGREPTADEIARIYVRHKGERGFW